MTLNVSSQLVNLVIGSQNWSAWIESIQIGYGEYEMGSGLMPCTGTVNLIFPANYAGIPSNPEYRFNSAQWKRGQLIQISANASPLPCSGLALKIIKPPQRPSRDQNGIAKMALTVGCSIAYEYFPPEPNDNFSGITAGTPKTRGAIINSILGTLKIVSSVVIPEYSINYPLPKIDGNWLSFCGQIADSAGYYLRCNTNGAIVAEKILNTGSSGITYTIGVDESDWTAIGDVGEQPIEKLIITGVNKTLGSFDGNPNVVVEYKTYAGIAPNIPVSKQTPFVQTIDKRTTTTKSKTANVTTLIEEIIEPYAKIAPDLPVSQSAPFALTISKRTTTKTFFASGFIVKKEEEIIEPYSAIAPDLLVSKTSPFVLTVSKRTTQEWQKIAAQKYRETFTELKPYSAIDPALPVSQSAPFVLTISAQKITEGESAPPTDQPISDFELKEEQISSQVFASQLAPSDGRQRQRTIALPFASAISQLTAYGQLFNKVLTGRAFGWRFATRLNTSLLPMQLATIIDGTQGYLFRLDALQWAMTMTESYLVINGIEVGTFNTATPSIISYPVSFPLAPVPAQLINANYSERIILDLSAQLVNNNYGQYILNAIFTSLINSNYAEITANSLITARLINSNYAGTIANNSIAARLINANSGQISLSTFARLINKNYSQVDSSTFARLINTNYAILDNSMFARLINKNYSQVSWTPSAITTALWLDAADSSTITTISSAVSQWNDKSSNARNASQSSASSRPTLGSLNGLATLSFDGSNDFLDLQRGFFVSNDYSLFILATPSLGIEGYLFQLFNETSLRQSSIITKYASKAYEFYESNGAARFTLGAESLAGFNLISYDISGTTVAGYANGTASGSGSVSGSALEFRTIASALTSNYTQSQIAEIIVLPTMASTQIRQNIEGYLAYKWGLTANLPSGHPYKTSPP